MQTAARTHGLVTVRACFDSGWLDIEQIGMGVAPDFRCTRPAKAHKPLPGQIYKTGTTLCEKISWIVFDQK